MNGLYAIRTPNEKSSISFSSIMIGIGVVLMRKPC
jgi:hypothetical protein